MQRTRAFYAQATKITGGYRLSFAVEELEVDVHTGRNSSKSLSYRQMNW